MEKKLHIQNNKNYRSISFRFLLGYSLLFIFMFYLYGVFDLFQHGCDEKLFKGCEYRNSPIVSENIKNSGDYNSTEAIFQSFSYLLGFYINIQKTGVLSAAWAHLLFSFLIAFDVYIQKIENYFTVCSIINRRNYRHLSNENIRLKALFSDGDGLYLNESNNSELIEDISSSLSYNLSISKMENLNEYEDLFVFIN